VLSPCMDSTYKVITNILDEVADLFPGKYIHIGSDERAKDAWGSSPKCIAMMNKLNFIDTDQLQNYFSKRIQTILANKQKAIGGWEEIIKGGDLDLNLNPLIYSWTDIDHGIQAAKLGYDVVMSPSQYLYLELAYSPDPHEPGDYWAGYVDTFMVYSYRPIVASRVTPDIAGKIKGIEGDLWSEFIDSPERLDYFAFPKMAALAEVAWTPARERNWQNFSARLGFLHLARLDNYGVLYRLSPPGIVVSYKMLHAID
jgi:hexosaminidase